jgi:peptidoglycan/LPS O-acetylase OafA/YrhL
MSVIAKKVDLAAEKDAAIGSRHRLRGVDGLRAVAALWVVLFHIHAFSGAHIGLIPGVDLFLRSGSTGVSLFLVLSGFCLYLPFSGYRNSRFDTKTFLIRRCRRLLPAYYVSLAITIAVVLVAGSSLGLATYRGWPAVGQLLTHMSMTHVLFPSSFYALNGAYWSLALEWQLYLALPLLIFGIRRWGLAWTAAAAISVNVVYRLLLFGLISQHRVAADSLLATAVLPNQLPGRWAEFVFGMVAAELHQAGVLVRMRLIWAGPVMIALVALSLLSVGNQWSHILFGGVFVLLLGVVLKADNLVATVISWNPLARLGTMSYSLYLVHQPIVQALAHLLRNNAGLSPGRTFVMLIGLLPVIVFVAWLLFVSVERYTLTSSGVGARPWWETLAARAAAAAWRPMLAVTATENPRR